MITTKVFQKKVGEFISYLDIEKNLSIHTQRAYQGDLEQFVNFWKRVDKKDTTVPINRIIERFLVFMYNEKINKNTIARKISCLKSFQKYLKSDGIELKLNINRPKTGKRLPVYLSTDEMLHLLDNIKHADLPTKKPMRDTTILELLYATGVRCSELVSICFNDIDFSNKTIRIMGKGGKERIVLFGNKAKEKLISYIEQERAVVHGLEEHIFLNNSAKPITVRTVQRTIEMFRKFLKIERPITPHKIRHSFATHMLNQGVALRVVQELLGHKSLSSTEIYTHVTTTELSELCNTIHPIKNMMKKKK
jgi:site-specific recombinase XerD